MYKEELKNIIILKRKYIKDILEVENDGIRPYRDDMDINELKHVILMLKIKIDIIVRVKDCKVISFDEWKNI
jgi:hypothetical protein